MQNSGPSHSSESPPAPTGNGPVIAPGLEIREASSRRALDHFARFPGKIYADDPCWVPPLLIEVKEFLNARKHPFYLHGAAVPLLAWRDGVPVGRVLVSDDPRYNRQWQANTGCFGMFECIDDETVAAGLLDAAARWLRARGRTAVMGPVDYSTNYPVGLLIDGFDTPPRVMMNHHPPYYARLLESWGLAKAKDLYAWWFDDPHDMVAQWRARAERIVRRGGVTVRGVRRADFDAEVERCRTVYNRSQIDNWGAVRLTREEFTYLARQLVRFAPVEMLLLAEREGEPVGFAVTVPDFNEAIHPLQGRLTRFGIPVGLLRLLRRMRRVKNARMLVLDVLPEYRRRGIAELLILRTLDHGKNALGYTGAELSWTLEDNDLINRAIEKVGGRRYKTYRIYEKELPG